MKYISFIIVVLLFFAFLRSYGQDASVKKNQYDVNVKVKTDQESHYPQGDEKLYEEVFYHLDYPEEARQSKVIGTVTLSFTVFPDGSLHDFVVVKGVGFGVEEALIEVLKNMKFAPAIQNGIKVRSTLLMNFPVSAT